MMRSEYPNVAVNLVDCSYTTESVYDEENVVNAYEIIRPITISWPALEVTRRLVARASARKVRGTL